MVLLQATHAALGRGRQAVRRPVLGGQTQAPPRRPPEDGCHSLHLGHLSRDPRVLLGLAVVPALSLL